MAKRIGVGKLAGAFIGLNMLDCGLTTYMLGKGGTELNPFMNSVIQESPSRFWLIKLGGSIGAVAIMLLLDKMLSKTRFAKYYVAERALILINILLIGVLTFNLTGLARSL
jgi:hypothetical protein